MAQRKILLDTDQPGPSRVEVRHIAHAYVLGISLVSDDRDLLKDAPFDLDTDFQRLFGKDCD